MTNPVPDTETAETPAPRRARRWPVVIAAILAAYALAWGATALVLRHQVTQWIGIQRANGVTMTFAALETSGFPGPVELTARDVAAAAPVTGGGWTWRTPMIAVKAWPLAFWWMTVDLSARQSIAGVITPPGVPLRIDSTAARVNLRLDLKGRLREATLAATGLSAAIMDTPPLMRLEHGTVTVALLHPAPPPENAQSPTLPATARITADLGNLALTAFLPAPLNQPVTHAAGTVEITGDVRDGPLPQVLEAWRADGGTVEVRDALIDWPPLHLDASGTFALDRQLQPEGAFSARIQGGGEAVDALAAAGWMEAEEAGLAKIALAVVSKTGADGTTPEVTVPLTIQERRLSAGPVTVMEMPEIDWQRVLVP
jgi:hypothetical protein